MIQNNVYNFEQSWLEKEQGGLLGSVEIEKGHQAVHETPNQLLSKARHLLSHSTRAHAYRRGKRFAYCLVPSLLRSRIWNEAIPKAKQFPTSYLSGLRGIAAVKVFTFHYLHFFSDSTFVPYGRDEDHKKFLQLPIVQFLYAGTTAQVFFIVAGYLTSLQLIKLFDSHDQPSRSKAFLNISGSLFRRWFRLYLPTMIIMLTTAHYIYFGFYEQNRNFYNQRDRYFPGPWTEPMPEQYSTYRGQMANWAQDFWGLNNVWARSYRPQHDVHLWSILVEFQSSLVLYLILMATAQCRKHVRMLALCIMTVLTLLWDHGETWMYTIGGMVAQMDLLLTEREQQKKLSLPADEKPLSTTAAATAGDGPKNRVSFILWSHFHTPSAAAWTFIRLGGYLAAFWMMSYPMWGYGFWGFDAQAPGYVTLNRFIPKNMEQKERFYPCVGSTVFLIVLTRADPKTSVWRQIFDSDWAQYLGKVSFALYLVHGPLLHAVVYLVPHWVWWLMGVEGIETNNFLWTVAIVIGWCTGLILSLWAADVWQREVEARCIKVAQKLEKWCFVEKAS